MEALRLRAGARARVVCVSFERFGEGSDKDGSFCTGCTSTKGAFFNGELLRVEKSVYEALFQRKGLFNNFYGLLDMSGAKVAESRARGVTGNFAGDGMQLGGAFVVRGGEVVLDKRQGFYGDDADPKDIEKALFE